ncbi:MAG: methyltransferase domain-containing protein [Pirellulaceae bacterium]|nr:methyltransferase domain-containing protein [Pirellulaceae bacterium]
MSRNLDRRHVCGSWHVARIAVLVLAAVAVGHGESRQVRAAENPPPVEADPSVGVACRLLADQRLDIPVRSIVAEYTRRTGSSITARLLPVDQVHRLVEAKQADCDVVLCMAKQEESTPVSSLPTAKTVAWKHPTGEPVWGAVIGGHPAAPDVVRFVGGATGHRLWSESPAGFTIVSGKSHAEAFQWVADNRVAHTYPMTAMRMLRECGVREGVCIDIGCGPGNLDVELAKRSNLTIIGLDIDGDMKPLFEQKMRDAGIQERVRFVEGDAQKLPFPDDHADMIVSRGTLTFIPDIAQCLREVDRVLKPSGVALLGGRYVYTPQAYKISDEKLGQIVAESGVAGAQLITDRGQWVKIIGPQAPEAARQVPSGPHLLAGRFIADYAIIDGKCLLLGGGDGALEQALQAGFIELTDMHITALYAKEEEAAKARERIRAAKQEDRITCAVGNVHDLPFEDNSFDAVVGTGPFLLWGDREKGMQEIHRVLRTGGTALVGGRFQGMPAPKKVPSETLRASAAKTGIPTIRVIDDMGQWIEIRKGLRDRGLRD